MQRRPLRSIARACAHVLALTAALAALAAPHPALAIVGGLSATEPYPWAVAISQPGYVGSFCSGSLVASRWVLTAAHCVASISNPAAISVRAGSWNRNAGGGASVAVRLLPSRDYNPWTLAGDFALIELRDALPLRPISLAGQGPDPGGRARLLGWGQRCATRGCDYGSDWLQELDAVVVPNDRCAGRAQPATAFCVAGVGGQSACFGDSGGPVLVAAGGQWVLAGDTSYGPSPCDGRRGTIATRLSAYRDEIASIVGST
ncbi:MAG TPA: serine protease [Candidatus Dormibacteraeota bacterium]